MTSPSAQMSGQTQRNQSVVYAEETAGSGWLFFAGTILGLAGVMRIVDSIWAFSYKGALPDGLKDGVLGSNLKHYAWAWLIVGIVLIISSALVLMGSQFARWVGLFAAAIGALSAMTWMPYYPVWSLTYVGIAVLTFYALARYGGRQPV
ncbi:MAG: DUF7144 family membrane protein [Actinomycetota bacterium]